VLQLSELHTLLDSELNHCLLLTNILLAERKLIETRRLDELPSILRQKADLLAVIESGTANDKAGYLQWTCRHPIQSFKKKLKIAK
jgi:flagellar biosynthesis/type III secretory pathway chaperone